MRLNYFLIAVIAAVIVGAFFAHITFPPAEGFANLLYLAHKGYSYAGVIAGLLTFYVLERTDTTQRIF